MSATGPSSTEQLLRGLRARFAESSERTVAELRRHGDALSAAPDDDAALEALQRALHRVRGTSGTYGFLDASRLAATLELRVTAWRADRGAERAERAAIARAFTDAIAGALRVDRDGSPVRPLRRLALVALPPELASAIGVVALRAGYSCAALDIAQCASGGLAALAPGAVVAPAEAAAQLGARVEAGVPLLSLERGMALADVVSAVERLLASA